MEYLSILSCCIVIASVLHLTLQSDAKGEIEDPHRDPSLCEVCKFLTEELKGRLDETGKTKAVVETGYGFDQKKKKKKYVHTELRLIEALTDPHVCNKILEYNVHAERKGSLRFSKGMSETMQTLHGLVDKGVKVDLGIPHELWDSPSASVTDMQRKCFKIVELYEEDIEDWYFNKQGEDLTEYLCNGKVLKYDDKECLAETATQKDKKGMAKKNSEKKESSRKDKQNLENSADKDEL